MQLVTVWAVVEGFAYEGIQRVVKVFDQESYARDAVIGYTAGLHPEAGEWYRVQEVQLVQTTTRQEG